MKTFRTALLSLCAVTVALPALAIEPCVQPGEKTAFDVRALQSQLMVAALTCGQQDNYNQFVQRFQVDLNGAYRVVSSHFRRTAGRASERTLDLYITNLANGQSQEAIRQGSFFCRDATPLWPRVMAVQGGAQGLAQLAVASNVTQTYTPGLCTTTTPGTTGRRVTQAAARTR